MRIRFFHKLLELKRLELQLGIDFGASREPKLPRSLWLR
jgi:hypothetical protein